MARRWPDMLAKRKTGSAKVAGKTTRGKKQLAKRFQKITRRLQRNGQNVWLGSRRARIWP
jgi:hypothetical protein